MRSVSLGQLKADAMELANVAGATTRFSPTLITRRANQSIQRFREKVSTEGSTRFLTAVSGTLGVGPTSPYPFHVLDLGAVATGIVRTYGLDITVDGDTQTLLQVPFADRDKYGGGRVRGVPCAWAHYQDTKVAVLPPPASAYTYVAWFLPVLPDLVNDSDTFDGVAGHEEFITHDMALTLVARDQYPEAYQLLASRASDIWQDIMRTATKVTSAGGLVIGRDTLGDRLSGMVRGKGRLPPP
jgi:hypothetical protein